MYISIQPSWEVLNTFRSQSGESKMVGPNTCYVAFSWMLIRTVRADLSIFEANRKLEGWEV